MSPRPELRGDSSCPSDSSSSSVSSSTESTQTEEENGCCSSSSSSSSYLGEIVPPQDQDSEEGSVMERLSKTMEGFFKVE